MVRKRNQSPPQHKSIDLTDEQAVLDLLSDRRESNAQKKHTTEQVMATKPNWLDLEAQKEMTRAWWRALEFMDAKVQDDMEFIREIVMEGHQEVLQFASERIQADLVTAFIAITEKTVEEAEEWAETEDDHGYESGLGDRIEYLQYAKGVMSDRNNVKKLCGRNGDALGWATVDEFFDDRKIVWTAVKSNGVALEFAGDELKKDVDLVMEAVKSNGYALKFVSPELLKNAKVVSTALRELWGYRHNIGLKLINDLNLRDITTSYEVLRLIGEYEGKPLTPTTRTKHMLKALAVEDPTAADEADRKIILDAYHRINKRASERKNEPASKRVKN